MNIKYNREDILDEGGKLIRLHGYHKTGINDIIQAANISKGSFYSHFDSKEDFVIQLIKRFGENHLKIIKYFLNNEQLSPLNRLNQYYQSNIDYHIAHNFKDGCLLNNLSVELSGSSEVIRNHILQQFTSWKQIISTCIGQGQKMGEIVEEYPAEELAEVLQSSYCGAVILMKTAASVDPLELWRKHVFMYLRA